jgi:hypothetical protein
MLDTVILEIEQNCFVVNDGDRFNPPYENLINSGAGFMKSINNPTTEENKDGLYRPRLTMIKRGAAIVLKIEFSAPKLLYGNNLDELDDNNFDTIVEILRKRIKGMGVDIWTHGVANAKVTAFHPSKNIVLTGGYSSSLVIGELGKINTSQRIDLNQTVHRNKGQTLQFYYQSNSFVIYDKIADLNKDGTRAIDSEQLPAQRSLIEQIKERREYLEILRLEVRLIGAKKLNDVLKKVGAIQNPNFRQIFNSDICKKVVRSYWESIINEDNYFLFDMENDPRSLLQKILITYSDMQPAMAVKLVGLSVLAKGQGGIRGLKNCFNNKVSSAYFTRLKNDLNKLNGLMFCNNRYQFINDISEQINRFSPYRYVRNSDLPCKEK